MNPPLLAITLILIYAVICVLLEVIRHWRESNPHQHANRVLRRSSLDRAVLLIFISYGLSIYFFYKTEIHPVFPQKSLYSNDIWLYAPQWVAVIYAGLVWKYLEVDNELNRYKCVIKQYPWPSPKYLAGVNQLLVTVTMFSAFCAVFLPLPWPDAYVLHYFIFFGSFLLPAPLLFLIEPLFGFIGSAGRTNFDPVVITQRPIEIPEPTSKYDRTPEEALENILKVRRYDEDAENET